MTAPATPARRLRRPGWRDWRLLVGLLLVLVSVAGGARLVSWLDETVPVYAAARPLLPGQELAEEDLVPVAVRLEEPLPLYLDGTEQLRPGTYALRRVAEGELVPAAALGTAAQVRDKTVTVAVDPASTAALQVGSVVDIWVSHRDREAVGAAYRSPELLLSGALVAGLPQDSRALGIGVGRAAVQVVVPADSVAPVIASVDQEAKVTLVAAPGAGAG